MTDLSDLSARFARLAAPTPRTLVKWRSDDDTREGTARHVAYVSSQFVRQRLDEFFSGEWGLAQESVPGTWADKHGVLQCVMQATITIHGLARSSLGMGADPKTADSDSFKRAGVRWGIASDLYSFPPVYVRVSGGKPIENPWDAYDRAMLRKGVQEASPEIDKPAAPAAPKPALKKLGLIAPELCPTCGKKMWNNVWVRKPGQPDFVCTDKACKGVVRLTDADRAVLMAASPTEARAAVDAGLEPALVDSQDDLPF